MSNLSVSVGSRWLYGERVVEIDGALNIRQVQVRDMRTGELLPVSMHELQPPPTCNPKQTDPLVVPQPEWDRALFLAKAFTPYIEQRHLPRKIAEALAGRLGVSVRQLLRCRAEYQKRQTTTSLVRSKGGRPHGLRMLDVRVEQVIAHVVDKHYLRREKTSISDICERVRLICLRLNLRVCAKTVMRRIHELNDYEVARRQLGIKAAKQLFAARPGKMVIDQPLALVQIDHTPCDILLVADDDPGKIIGRPWLTLAIDVATRVALGYYLSMDAPSTVSVAMCLAHVMLPKVENTSTNVLWPMYGIPSVVLLDNAKEFHSVALQRGCDQHGITLNWRPVKEPHYGAHIERLMGTFMKMVHTLPGTTFSNPKQRGDYPSERKACLTFADFQAWLVEKICHYYHVKKHRGLDIPPLVAWERAFRQEDGSFALPELPINQTDLCRDFFPFVYRRLQRTGVQYAQSRYWHESLAPLIYREPKVRVHYHPNDPSKVWVRTASNDMIEASAVAGAALNEGHSATLPAEERARLDALMDQGYECTDAIRNNAETRRRKKARRSAMAPGIGSQRRHGSRPAATPDDATSSRHTVPLNRSSVRAEVLD